jgi:ferritin-like metal-binding protein YciE
VVPELAFRLSTREFREHHKALIGSLIAWARELDRADCAEVLEQTLAEEKAVDAKLTKLAESRLNRTAA